MDVRLIFTLVAAGIATGLVFPGRFEYVFGAATLYVFLPPLLFEAAWNLNATVLRAQRRPVFALAVPGVLVTTLVVGGALHLAALPWAAALLVGAMVSATDPIAIVATFKKMPVPLALATIVEAESLLNDAMAAVVYRVLLAALVFASGTAAAMWASAVAVAGSLAGIAFGIGVAYAVALLVVRRNVALAQAVATLAGAYAVYFAAEALHLSAIFAVVAFGIALRAFERRSLAVDVAEAVESFWSRLAWCSNAIVFFLTGAAVEVGRAVHEPWPALAGIAGAIVARAILAYGLTPLACRGLLQRGWLHVLRAADARGALALALAIALPAAVPQRGVVVDVTLAIVLLTLLASAFTVPRAVRGIGTAAL